MPRGLKNGKTRAAKPVDNYAGKVLISVIFLLLSPLPTVFAALPLASSFATPGTLPAAFSEWPSDCFAAALNPSVFLTGFRGQPERP